MQYPSSEHPTPKLKRKKPLKQQPKQLRKLPVTPHRKTTGNPPMAQAKAKAGTAGAGETPGAGGGAGRGGGGVFGVVVGRRGTVVVASKLQQTTIPDPYQPGAHRVRAALAVTPQAVSLPAPP